MLKKWTKRVTTGLVAAGLAVAAQSAPALADQQAAPDSGTTTVAASEVDGGTVDVSLTEAAPEAGAVTAACGGWRGALASYSKWKVDKSSCGWITLDSKKNPQHRRYTWRIPPGSNSRICVQARGIYYSTAKKKMVGKWTTAGCGTGGTVLVRWSGIPKKNGGYSGASGVPQVRAKVQPGFGGVAYSWK
ncbi:hypothetical protein [Kribbella speibonae]|uniref:Uncharacterized protein n=1 Tax=Kribbella speibonae TaxID=1572660 RepID=A0A4R0IUK6_9ACTN|nr:hypothetical protein [Kribbella speibonae]TCC36184.1 hypothetical protein E0H92_26340 [Kribbella speibonae]